MNDVRDAHSVPTMDAKSWFLGRVLDEVEKTKEEPINKPFTFFSLRPEEVTGRLFWVLV